MLTHSVCEMLRVTAWVGVILFSGVLLGKKEYIFRFGNASALLIIFYFS